MKLEAFEYNLRHKTVPFAQNIVVGSGNHPPTVLTYDKNGECSNTLQEVVERCKVIFLCLPTPMIKETGKCYTGILEEVLTLEMLLLQLEVLLYQLELQLFMTKC